MIKLNIQLFGGGTSADAYDDSGYDPNPGNSMIDIRVGSNTYSFPKALFDNVGAHDGKNNPEKGYVAAVYAAYFAATGKDPYDVAKEQKGTVTTTSTLGYPGAPTQTFTRNATDDELNDYILNTVLKDWMTTQGEPFDPPTDYNKNNLNQLHSDSKSFQKGITTANNTGAVKVNGQSYTEWKQTQPQFQEGYTEGLGVPIAKDAAGNWIYQDESGTFLNRGGEEIIDFTGVTDLSGNAARIDPESNVLINTETGAPVVTPTPEGPTASPVNEAFNQYYNDLYSRKEGTLGKGVLDNNISLFEKEASNAAILADTSMQAQAMQQAQAVKQVTDSLRSERAAQLRAGMSESQLADRELQMLMGSVNQMSGQAQMASQEATAAQLGQSTARENAFNQYIEQTTLLGQNAAANYASNAGDVMAQATAYQRKVKAETGRDISIGDALNYVGGIRE